MLRILTDDGADLPFVMREHYDIEVLPIGLTDGEYEFEAGRAMDLDTFYDNMREGVSYSTSRVSMQAIEEAFSRYLNAGDEILYISLSSGLSASYEGASLVKSKFEEDFPGKIYLIDSKTATFGEGILAVKAAILREEGASAEAIYNYLEGIKEDSFEFFTVSNLTYLHRGGRVSKATKIAGGVLQLAPILEVEKELGTLKLVDVYRGQKSFFKKLKAYMNEKSEGGVFHPEQTVFVYAGDWPERVELIRRFLIREMGMKEENINTGVRVGSIIGAHTGPEVAIVTFSGKPDRLAVLPE